MELKTLYQKRFGYMDWIMQPNAINLVIISGPVGVGKTTVSEELSGLLEQEGIGHTFVDLDGLSKTYPRPAGDRFGEQIALKNLGAVWSNAFAMGIRNLIIARVVETAGGAQRISNAVGAATGVIVQLNASDSELLDRVGRREIGTARDWHESRAIMLSKQLRDAPIADLEIDTDHRSVQVIAQELLNRLDWA